jgi:hypothetical protein
MSLAGPRLKTAASQNFVRSLGCCGRDIRCGARSDVDCQLLFASKPRLKLPQIVKRQIVEPAHHLKAYRLRRTQMPYQQPSRQPGCGSSMALHGLPWLRPAQRPRARRPAHELDRLDRAFVQLAAPARRLACGRQGHCRDHRLRRRRRLYAVHMSAAQVGASPAFLRDAGADVLSVLWWHQALQDR